MKRFRIVVLTLILMGCAHTHHSNSGVENGSMRGSSYAYRSNTYFMDQPNGDTLDEAKNLGVTTVINLRTENEMKELKFNEAEEVKKRGINYYHYPIDPSAPLSKETLAKIEQTYMAHHKKGEKVIVHCASGQRSAAWFAYHVRFTHGENAEQALREAKEVGLSHHVLTENVKSAIQ